MKQNESGVVILSETKNGERIVSCGGRISTKPGTAIEFYKKATDKNKNLNLISKVVASGHKTILEHHYFNLAFNNVSIFVEQYLVEFRLASFTIKSGRYVNFSSAGFNLPDEFSSEQKKKIKAHYREMFKVYDTFVAGGIPVEDARFVLPYGLKTNIYMSLNARELIHVICTMIYGRGKHYSEIYALGLSLKEQFDARYPGIIETNKKYYTDELDTVLETSASKAGKPQYVKTNVKIVASSTAAKPCLDEFAKFCGYSNFNFETALKDDKLSKFLEHFSYTFEVENFSQIVLKHYTRHRMQTLSTIPLVKTAQINKFIVPETIEKNPEFLELFKNSIEKNRKVYNYLVEENVDPHLLVYIAPHATAINFVSTMNARELLHFMNLRTCNRAQWEIRNLATNMLRILKKQDKELFKNYGPSCYTFGACPEGRLSCGKIIEMKEKFENLE